MPCSKNNGATAHWALLCGVIIARHDDDRSKPKHKLDWKTKKVTNDDLDRDANNIWLIGRHGKNNGQYVVWSFRDLLESNRQLFAPAPKIMNTIPDEVKATWFKDERDLKPLVMEETELYAQEQDAAATTHTSSPLPSYHLLAQSPASPPSPDRSPTSPSPSDRLPTSPPLLAESPASPSPQPLSIPLPPPPPKLPLLHQPLDTSRNDNERPYVLPDGPRLDLCLAKQYVGFKPLHKPNAVSFFDHPHNTHVSYQRLYIAKFTIGRLHRIHFIFWFLSKIT